MPDEMEEMEARLAGYVDGTLPPEQRAEIEAYLKANPTHARLITELQSIKSAVATLPKEKAPVEVLDSLQAHLERQTLLENVEDAATPLRINRWPQLGAVAAVLLLTAGLGLLIYQVLPNGRPAKDDLALLSSSAASRPGDNEAAPGEGVTLGETANSAAPGVLTPQTPLAKADSDVATRNLPNRQQPLNNINNMYGNTYSNSYGRDETQLYQQSQLGTPQQSQQNTHIGINENVVVGGGGGAGMNDSLAAGRSKAEQRFSETKVSATQSSEVKVLLVRTEDPALTANLLIGGFVQDSVPFERVTPASTQPVEASVAGDVDDVVSSLQLSGELSPTLVAREFPSSVRPLWVPAGSGEVLRKALTTVATPGLGQRENKVIAFTRRPVDSLGATALPQASDFAPRARLRREVTAVTEAASQPAQGYVLGGTTTLPFYKQSDAARADLLILIVRDTPPPASQPALTPTTTPASQPVMTEMP